ncbi:MAG TPA: DUF3024 domain-containing protein [Thermoanaerobaculia bacterium]|nr:DUF3024 domain-containing protein [Thermoanaerobaculia bacterium]
MSIPSDVRDDAEGALAEFCAQHSSEGVRYVHQFESNAALLLAERPGFMNQSEWVSTPMAKFRYSQARNNWSLYWTDSSERWHRVSNAKAEKDIRALLDVVLKDPLGVFWS